MTKPFKVAIIEDDKVIVEMYKTKLELSGYDVETASDGIEGLALVEKINPDVILLDLMMPNMSGIETLTILRKKPGGDKYKIMILSNMGDSDTVDKIKKIGINDYIIKADLTPSEVEARVRKLLEASS